MDEQIKCEEIAGWLYLKNPKALANKKELDIELQKQEHGTLGKYLFFSNDKKLLIGLAKEILAKYNLFSAKVSTREFRGFVLCIYDSSPKLKQELRQYADEKKIKYRHWKSDAQSLRGGILRRV